MKKILLATTMLTMTAGAAAADGHMTWGASAAAGIASQAGGNFETYSSVNIALTLAGQTDGGLTFGASFDMTAGRSYALADDDGFADEGGAFGMPTIFVAGSFGKLEISDDNFDFFDDAHANGDVKYTGTFGAINAGLVANIDNNTASVSLGYTAGNLALSLNADNAVNDDATDAIADGTDEAQTNISATYTMGTIAITASSAINEDDDSALKVAYTGANGMSASAQYNTSDESIDLAGGYSANGLSVDAEFNTESENWTVTGSYDLGGGLTVEAGTNYTEDMMIGAAMSF
jgi:outer membrane protein OmpU